MEMELLKQIAAAGLMGLVAALFIWIAHDRDKKLFASLTARISDNEAVRSVIGVVNSTLASMQISIDNRAIMTSKIEETMRGVATAQMTMNTLVENLRKTMESQDRDFEIFVARFEQIQSQLKEGHAKTEESLRRIETIVRHMRKGDPE